MILDGGSHERMGYIVINGRGDYVLPGVDGGHAATHLRVYRRAYLIGGYNANLLRHNPYPDHP